MKSIDNAPYYFGSIRPALMNVDTDYQHPVDQNRVARIVKNWNGRLVNPPKVSLREDGTYWIFDGQHTVAAWQIKFGDEPILCRIYTRLTREDEKDLFVQQNGFSKQPTSIEKLRAEYNLGNPKVVDMVDSAKLLDLTVVFGTNTTGKNIINAADCLNNIYNRLGRDNYINILTVIKNTWNGEDGSLTRGIISGVAFIYEHYSDIVTNSKMIEALKRHTPDYYLREAKDLSGSLGRRVAKIMANAYNYRRTQKRLPEF